MKTKTFGLVALLAIGCLTLTGCNKTENPDENVGIANPASVYCEEQGGTLNLEEWLCMFSDGSYCEQWAYERWECQPWEIMYNTISEEETSETNVVTSDIYSQEDLDAAQAAIMNVINNEWEVKVEWVEITYAGDEVSAANLESCQDINPEATACVVFVSKFHIPEQDTLMAGGFEPNTDINDWSWTLGKNATGEWEVLNNWLG